MSLWRILLSAGAVLFIVVTAMSVTIFNQERNRLQLVRETQTKKWITRHILLAYSIPLDRYRDLHSKSPTDAEQLADYVAKNNWHPRFTPHTTSMIMPHLRTGTDAWGNQLHIRSTDTQLRIFSAGPDQTVNTDDDLHREYLMVESGANQRPSAAIHHPSED